MILQGIKEIDNLVKNIYVKVPVCNSQGNTQESYKRTRNDENIKLNITAVYDTKQVKNILKNINKKTEVIINFAGRMADVGKDPIPVFKKETFQFSKFKNVKILWASTREAYNYYQASKINCHIITIPPSIIEKIENFGKSLKHDC